MVWKVTFNKKVVKVFFTMISTMMIDYCETNSIFVKCGNPQQTWYILRKIIPFAQRQASIY